MHAEGLLLALVGVDKLQIAFMSSFETFAPLRCRADEFREACIRGERHFDWRQ